MKLLYWDIDGTLLNTGHAGLNAIKEVLRDLNGEDTPVPKIDAGGRTDNYICQQLLYKSTGVMPTDEEVFAFCRNYEQKLLKWLKRKAHEGVILPNAAEKPGLLPWKGRLPAAPPDGEQSRRCQPEDGFLRPVSVF